MLIFVRCAVFEPCSPTSLSLTGKKGRTPTCVATSDEFLFLTETSHIKLPNPPQMHNTGNYIISLGALGKWLASQTEELGVEIYPGFAASEILYHEDGTVKGIATGMWVSIRPEKKPQLINPAWKSTPNKLSSPKAAGSLTKHLIQKFDLRKIQIPNLWFGHQRNLGNQTGKPPYIVHTGWPLDPKNLWRIMALPHGKQFGVHRLCRRAGLPKTPIFLPSRKCNVIKPTLI